MTETSLKILVADDEELSARSIASLVEALGHQVVGPALSGTEAVELAADAAPDLAILDIFMPGLTGVEVAERLASMHPIPVIFLTAYREPEDLDRVLHLPVFHYLVKPISPHELGPAIRIARARFAEWHSLCGTVDRLHQRLEDRKLIERAKGVLMEARGITEPEAYRMLQRESQNRSRSMAELARTVLESAALLRASPDGE